MPRKFKLNAILIVLVSVLFSLFFEISKHNPFLSHINAFAEDPYDGIGSMGVQAALLLATLSLLRAFWPHPTGASENRKAIFARTETMALLAVGITLAADAIAMLRHTSLWVGSTEGRLLAALLAGIALLTAGVGSWVYRSVRGIALPEIPNAWARATAISFATVLVLVFYPESWRQSTPGAIFTALVGGVLLFVPVWAIGTALIPYCEEVDRNDPVTVIWSYLRQYQWVLILLLGALTGFSLAMKELWNPRGWPHLTGRIALVISVYIGLETAGLLIGYALLRKPLGLFGENS